MQPRGPSVGSILFALSTTVMLLAPPGVLRTQDGSPAGPPHCGSNRV